MDYAKLIEGEISFAPRKVHYGETVVYNPPGEMLVELGYKPVTYTDPPVVEEGYIAVPGWEDDGGSIIQTWTVEEEPDEVDADRAMEILFGGEG